jgi:hypothetical protein
MGDHEANCQIFCWVVKDQGLKVVEGLAPSEMKEPTCSVGIRGAGNVGAPATWDNFAPTVGKENFG